MWIVDVTSTARVLQLQGSVTNAKVKNTSEFKTSIFQQVLSPYLLCLSFPPQIGQQGHTASTASLVVLVLLWQGVKAALPVSVTATVTLYKGSAITRPASATVPTTPKAHTVSLAYLDIMETPGEYHTQDEL